LATERPPRTPVPELPYLKQPVLPRDFQVRLNALDRQIHERGVAVSRERLVSLGKEGFTDLLAKDYAARSVQRVIRSKTDLTSWPWVEYTFAMVNGLTTSIKRRRNAEIHAGTGIDREAAGQIKGYDDLWKLNQNQQTVRDIYAFHDAFVSLVFAQSLLERVQDDGRARSSSFCGGASRKSRLFTNWFGALQGSHFTVTLSDPTWLVASWLAGEETPPPTTLAFDLLGVRAPSKEQLAFCNAVWHGFLLGHTSWALWDYVGRATRKETAVETLEIWRKDLALRYPAVQKYHDELKAAFLRPVNSAAHGHFQFDEAGYRKFVDRSVQVLLNRLSALVAMAVEETLPESVVARFENWLLCEVNSKKGRNFPKEFLPEFIMEKLEAAFPDQSFYHTAFKVEQLPA